jgi:DNA adenine methylase
VGVPHPIPYQGSKRNLAKYILQHFPENPRRLIEPFAGSAAISLAALHHKKVERIVIGDIDAPLIALWEQIANFPVDIADAYSQIWHEQLGQERIFYDAIRQEFNRSQRADYFLYLLVRCVKAAVRYNSNGEFNQSPDNRRKGTHPDKMRKNILLASKLLQGRAVIQHIDFLELLDEAAWDDIVYLDPPYQGVCKDRNPRYKEKITFDNFVNALDRLNARNISFIVSYDGRTEEKTYGEFLPPFLEMSRIELEAGQSTQATLLGRRERTFEALYLSPALVARRERSAFSPEMQFQLPLLEL